MAYGGDAAGVDAVHLKDNANGKLCKPPSHTATHIHPSPPPHGILPLGINFMHLCKRLTITGAGFPHWRKIVTGIKE